VDDELESISLTKVAKPKPFTKRDHSSLIVTCDVTIPMQGGLGE